MFEGLHQGRILCSAIADDTTLLTGGESTVSPILTCVCVCIDGREDKVRDIAGYQGFESHWNSDSFVSSPRVFGRL